ncbi:hypothetical protein [Alkalimarinus coralli]|uniref:hypothetical protein n=1 Tax=Alkalimarinus coralli TaxID=2935863 RepID=UPI00202B63EF|nr:hypothetical protein [Alkalimarinus coralli]
MDDMTVLDYLTEFELAVKDAREYKTLSTVGVALSWWQSLLDAINRAPLDDKLTQAHLLTRLPDLLPEEWGFWMLTWDHYHQERQPYAQCH